MKNPKRKIPELKSTRTLKKILVSAGFILFILLFWGVGMGLTGLSKFSAYACAVLLLFLLIIYLIPEKRFKKNN